MTDSREDQSRCIFGCSYFLSFLCLSFFLSLFFFFFFLSFSLFFFFSSSFSHLHRIITIVVVGAVVVLDGNVLSDWLQGRCPKKNGEKRNGQDTSFIPFLTVCLQIVFLCSRPAISMEALSGVYDSDVFISYFICHRHAHVLFILK